MKKLLPILLLTAFVAVEAKKEKKPSRWTKFTTSVKDFGTKVKDKANDLGSNVKYGWEKSLYTVFGVTDVVYLGTNQSVDTFKGEKAFNASKGNKIFGESLKWAIQEDISNRYEKDAPRNVCGLALPLVNWDKVSEAAIELVVKASNSEFVSKKLIRKAHIKFSKAIRANCGSWADTAQVIAAMKKADLSKLAKKNADFLENKKA